MIYWKVFNRHRCISTIIRGCYCLPNTTRSITINYRGSRSANKEDNYQDERNNHTLIDPVEHTRSPRTHLPITTSGRSALSLPLHDSLASFLTYATQTNLSPASTVFRGTKYEYTCLEALSNLGFKLTRVGGVNDAGIDLKGSWLLPTLPAGLSTLVQCKFLDRKSISPVLVRELEGAFSALPNANDQTVVGILCTPGLATKAVRETLRRCAQPVVLISIDEGGWIEAVVWNNAVKDICEGISVGMRYVGRRKEAFLAVGGQPWKVATDDNNQSDG